MIHHILQFGRLRKTIYWGKFWLQHEADLLPVCSAESQETRSRDPIVPMHVYAVHKNSRNTGWRERENEQDATNLIFMFQLLSKHVSGIIMPIIRRTIPCMTAYGVPHWWWWVASLNIEACVDLRHTAVGMHETEQHWCHSVISNKVLRNIVDAPWNIRNAELHRGVQMEMFTNEIRKFAKKHEEKLLHQAGDPDAWQKWTGAKAQNKKIKNKKLSELVWWSLIAEHSEVHHKHY